MVYLIKKLIFGEKKKERKEKRQLQDHISSLGKVANTSLRCQQHPFIIIIIIFTHVGYLV